MSFHNKVKKALRMFCIGIPIAVLSSVSSAEEVSFKFTGSLNTILDNSSFLHGEFAVGNSFEGVVTYDTNGEEGTTTLANPTTGIYWAVKRLRTSINGYEFDGIADLVPGFVQVWDDRVVGQNVVDSISFSSPLDYTPPIVGMGPGRVVGSISLSLFDYTHTASQLGKGIPSIFDFGDYGSSSFLAQQSNLDTKQAFTLFGKLTSMELVTEGTAAPIPEPSTYALMITGLVLLGRVVQRRKQKSEHLLKSALED